LPCCKVSSFSTPPFCLSFLLALFPVIWELKHENLVGKKAKKALENERLFAIPELIFVNVPILFFQSETPLITLS
jgi:hypothetical protein